MARLDSRIKRITTATGKTKYELRLDLRGIGKGQLKRQFDDALEAQAALRALDKEIATGQVVRRSVTTLGDVMDMWLAACESKVKMGKLRRKTLSDYARVVRLHIKPYSVANMAVQKVKARHLEEFYGVLAESGRGARTIQMVHQYFEDALDGAVRDDLVGVNEARKASAPTYHAKEMHYLTPEQARQFLTVAHQSIYGPLWILMLATGMRSGEARGLRWQDVDFKGRVIRVRQALNAIGAEFVFELPKTEKSRRDIHLNADTVWTALRAHLAAKSQEQLPRPDDLVFTTSVGKPIHRSPARHDFNRLAQLAGVPTIRVHDLRHTAATIALAHGADIGAVSHNLGHARTSITQDVYAHVLNEKKKEASDILSTALFG